MSPNYSYANPSHRPDLAHHSAKLREATAKGELVLSPLFVNLTTSEAPLIISVLEPDLARVGRSSGKPFLSMTAVLSLKIDFL